MITRETAGSVNGVQVERFCLRSETGISVNLLSLGATVQSIQTPDRCGRPVEICLGYPRPEDYVEGQRFFGACIGRCANRIGDSRFFLNGRIWNLTPNEGRHHLHGGQGFHKKLWRSQVQGETVAFSLLSPHLEDGYPGNLEVQTSYTLLGDRLVIEYQASCDQDTVVNLTNHSYFNLSGAGRENVLQHLLLLDADAYTPCDHSLIPTGEILPVTGTPLDFTVERAIGDRIKSPALSPLLGYDHNFVLRAPESPSDKKSGTYKSPLLPLRRAARLYSPASGIQLTVYTTMEGMQLYTDNPKTPEEAYQGAGYRGVCLETQHFPDAVNQPGFPSPVLKAGERYRHRTDFQFSIRSE